MELWDHKIDCKSGAILEQYNKEYISAYPCSSERPLLSIVAELNDRPADLRPYWLVFLCDEEKTLSKEATRFMHTYDDCTHDFLRAILSYFRDNNIYPAPSARRITEFIIKDGGSGFSAKINMLAIEFGRK